MWMLSRIPGTDLPLALKTKFHTDNGPESPTTMRPLDLDDDDIQDSSMITDDAHPSTAAVATATAPAAGATPANATEAAPPKPPRPQTETQKNEATLQEAFPTVEMGVIKAVLRASGGRVEPAFNALLEMTDPEAASKEPEEVAPPQPPRPQGQPAISQLEADERYARQLAEHYDNVGEYEARTSSRQNRDRQRQDWNEDDREHSFLDDDLPVIRENLRKGFLETQTTVNSWISNIRKKFEEFDTPEDGSQAHGQQQHQQQHQQQRRPGETSRRSNDYDRYDADPQVLGDDFANMRLNPDGSVNRTASPGVFRPPPPSTSPRPNDGRRVAFMEETEEINMYDASPKVPPKDTSPAPGGRASKWQPLSSVDPNPISDNDPFSLGDSEDEKDVKDKDKPKDSKADDNERLKQAAAEAMADSLVDSSKDGQAGSKKP
jgi:hypothetical protein